jgi:hypothetical protein
MRTPAPGENRRTLILDECSKLSVALEPEILVKRNEDTSRM